MEGKIQKAVDDLSLALGMDHAPDRNPAIAQAVSDLVDAKIEQHAADVARERLTGVRVQ
jgi:hypothetical protein